MTVSFVLTVAAVIICSYFLYKKFSKYWSDAEEVDHAIDKAHDMHDQAEKADTVDVKQYRRDKKLVNRVKDL